MKVVFIIIISGLVVGICVWAFLYLYPSVQIKLSFKKEITEIEYGVEFDPKALQLDAESLGLDSTYDLSYKYDIKKIGTSVCEITVTKGNGKRVYTHKIKVVDKTPPVFTVYYNYVTINDIKNIEQHYKNNVKGEIIDNYDGVIPIDNMEFVGEIKDKPDIYEIKYVVKDSSGNQAEATVYYLYKLTPESMKAPFYFEYNGEKHILANKWVPLPKDYNPGANKTARKKLNEMLAAMKKAGVGVSIRSGFRSYSTQARMWQRDVARYGETETAKVLARPGYSEHQTGFTYDIGFISTNFAKTKAYTWLQQHAHEYGFIMRYPKPAAAITGYSYEPWHYRYLGVNLATAIYNERHKEGGNPDLTLEEFIGYTHLK